jgi:peptidyl-prolyl cis-trans isomerase C
MADFKLNVKQITILAAGVVGVAAFGFWWVGSSKAVAKVNGEKITLEQFQNRLATYPPQFAAALRQRENRLKVLDQMVDEKVLLVAAKKEGYDKKKEYKDQIENTQNQLLLSMLVREKVEKGLTVSDSEVQQYYEANPAQFQAAEQRRAHHILVKTQAEAESILSQLKAKADFVALAKQRSIDPSAAQGGDLGWFSKGQLVPDFEKAVFAMNKGELSGVVRTQFGFHIIRLDDVAVRPRLEFEKVKNQIREALVADKRRRAVQTYLDQLKKEYKIKKDVSKI